MNDLELRWIALARWSGRIDPRLYLDGAVPADAPVGLVRSLREARGLEAQPTPFVRFGDPGYPAALQDLAAPPPVLWLRGDAELLEAPGLGVVGARACTPYGRSVASRLGRAAVAAGGVLVSGAARGIDRAAHEGALDGPTVAVLGSGLVARPSAWARQLHDRIAAHGLVVSELPPHDPATRWTFPRRNRLIAALSRAVVVVEAGRKSGALHTANAANALGRPLFAVPGRIDAPASAGCLQLIREGVPPLVELDEAIAALRAPDSPAARLLGALDGGPVSLTTLLARMNATPRDVLPLLAALELTGGVRRLADGRYDRP
ncbi:MAG: DNA-protecting protein DprA [Proteobacteria bacterium]|nr:DNA-protecting protein DprA [Pseudomonadota bacterium]MCP4916061.1 DNA-protecting protein DprA [Pseudomonadota bacterium]